MTLLNFYQEKKAINDTVVESYSHCNVSVVQWAKAQGILSKESLWVRAYLRPLIFTFFKLFQLNDLIDFS